MALDQHNACQSGAAGEPADDRHKQDHALNGDQNHDAKIGQQTGKASHDHDQNASDIGVRL